MSNRWQGNIGARVVCSDSKGKGTFLCNIHFIVSCAVKGKKKQGIIFEALHFPSQNIWSWRKKNIFQTCGLAYCPKLLDVPLLVTDLTLAYSTPIHNPLLTFCNPEYNVCLPRPSLFLTPQVYPLNNPSPVWLHYTILQYTLLNC